MNSARTVACPGCGGPSRYVSDNPWRPFCSERCKGADLGAWATESYRVEARPDPGDEDDALPSSPPWSGPR